MSEDDDQQHCVITGCIASDLLDRPTYIGQWMNDRQKYELTIPYARIMATRLKGKPLDPEHMEDIPIGTILHSWVQGRKWYIQAVVDQSTPAGIDMVKAVTGGQGSPFGQRIGEFSLATEGDKLTPTGVGIVVKGARDGCTIDNVSLVSSKELEAIKAQKYNIDDIDVPEHPPSETPRIAASFGEMTTHQSLRMPAPPTAYYPQEKEPSHAKTVADLQQQIAQMRGGTAPPQQPQQQHAAAASNHGGADEIQQLERRIAELKGHGQHQQQGAQWKSSGGPQPTGETQMDTLLKDLTPGAGGQPRTSNQNIIYTNPQDAADDARFMQIAGVFDSKIPTNQQKEQAARALTEAAQQSKADREALALKDKQVELLMKKLNEAEARNSTHQADVERQRKQAAMMLKRILQKNTPPATDAEQQELESGVNDMSEGKMDEAMVKLGPAMIRASAFIDAREAAESMEDEQNNSGYVSRSIRQALGQPAEGMIQASGANRKRSYDTSNTSYAAASSSGRFSNNNNGPSRSKNWERHSLQDDIPDFLKEGMEKIQNNPADYDTENMRGMDTLKYARRG